MALTKKEVEHVAELACLELSDGEKDLLTRQLGTILEYINTLDELDTSRVQPTSHVLQLSNVFREDVAIPSMEAEEILDLAPEKEKGHFKVPKIIS